MPTVQYYREAPDGGWGWFVVLSSFLCHLFVIATMKSFGVFFPYFLEDFGEDAGNTAWISSIQGSMTMFGAFLAGALSNVYGCRAVVMVGSLVATTGLISSTFVTSLPVMYLTSGVITGLGFSLMYSPCITMVGRYFKKRRALANGIGLSGAGVGTFALSPLFQLLIDHYGWRGSLFILAGVTLQGCVFGALLRPIYLTADMDDGKTIQPNDKQNPSEKSWSLVSICRLLDLSLFQKPYFVIFMISNMLMVFGNFIPFVHLVAHARNVGIAAQQAAFLVSVVGIGDGVSRVVYGWLSDLGLFVRLRGYIVCTLGVGLCMVFLPFAQTYPSMVACCLALGIFAGSYVTQTMVFLSEFCGVNRLGSAIGIAYGMQGFSLLFGPPIAGRLYDVTGNYTVSFYVAGGAILLSVLMVTALEVHRTKTSNYTDVSQHRFGISGSSEPIEHLEGHNMDNDVESIDDTINPLIIYESTV